MREGLIIGGIVISGAGLIGGCVADYAGAVRQMKEVTVTNKRYEPGHYQRICHTEYIEIGEIRIPTESCSNVWVPPQWSLQYEDESRHWTSIGQALHDELQLGDRLFVTYDEGKYTGIRYGESFMRKLPTVEKW